MSGPVELSLGQLALAAALLVANGAVSVAPHLRRYVESWPGGFGRDERDEAVLAENPLPPPEVRLEGVRLEGHTIGYAGHGPVTFRLDEAGQLIGFAGQRVIQETIRQTLPDGFQRAEYLLEHGMVDMVVPRQELRATLIRIISLIRDPLRLAQSPAETSRDDKAAAARKPAKTKKAARETADAAGR